MFQEARNHNRDFGLDGDFDSKAQAYVNATPGFAAATAAGIDLQDAVANFSVIRKALYTNSPSYGFEGQRLPANQRYNPRDPLEGLPRKFERNNIIDTPPVDPRARAADAVNTALAAGLPLGLLNA
jgi:hypothetical protein